MKTSPTQRSLKLLRDLGWTCAITEKYNSFIKVRQDLFGFIDILAITEGRMLAVQTTAGGGSKGESNRNARIRKIKSNPAYPILKSTGCNIEVHGWRKSKKGKRYLWECSITNL